MPPLVAFAFVFGLALLALAASVAFFGGPMPVIAWCGGFGLLLLVGTVFERVRYKTIAPTPPPGAGWVETPEKFRDPATGRWVQVYFKPETGERSYVETAPPPTN